VLYGYCCSHQFFLLLFLVLSFLFASAFLIFLLECEFLALIFIVVYVGAIASFIFICCYDVRCKITKFIKKFIQVFTRRIFIWFYGFLIPVFYQNLK
jgi:NADH:ubiquinone oxidoreductase subunit 6 (subunit J)